MTYFHNNNIIVRAARVLAYKRVCRPRPRGSPHVFYTVLQTLMIIISGPTTNKRAYVLQKNSCPMSDHVAQSSKLDYNLYTRAVPRFFGQILSFLENILLWQKMFSFILSLLRAINVKRKTFKALVTWVVFVLLNSTVYVLAHGTYIVEFYT